MRWLIALVERGLVPDWLVRAGIRQLLRRRLRDEQGSGVEAQGEVLSELVARWREGPVAVATEAANEQHYELPAVFFERVLGPHLKYSSCLWPDGVNDLAVAEEAMLAQTCERAGLQDGQHILELGCGWGSLTLYMAGHYPGARITAVSNSASQRAFIEQRRDALGLDNLEVVTADMNDFHTERRFDRVVSVEMFEHMRNHEALMRRIHGWLAPGGKLFVHIFVHRFLAYPFESEGDDDWMARYFFTGGVMPSDDLLLHYQRDLTLLRRWKVNGRHYQRTLMTWLHRMDAAHDAVRPVLRETYGEQQASLWFQRWRLFFLASAELFGFRRGNEWYVAHYLFGRQEDIS